MEMNAKSKNMIEGFFCEHTHLKFMEKEILDAIHIIIEAYKNGNKVLICGNGGSASDAEHIVGELMKGFLLERKVTIEDRKRFIEFCGDKEGIELSNNLQRALPAISLVSHVALNSAFINDVDPDMIYAQQIYGYKKEGDVVIGLSTSGNSKNVYKAMLIAKIFGLHTIAFTGKNESLLSETCDITIRSYYDKTYKIQEDHIKIYHLLCAVVEYEMFL